MVVVKNPEKIDKHAVGCILKYKDKFILFHRIKDGLWSSISGSLEYHDKSKLYGIKREIKEEIGLDIEPKYFTTTYHKYGSEIIAYHLFYFEFKKDPSDNIVLLDTELNSFGFFTLKEALRLRLFEDEDYCLKLYSKILFGDIIKQLNN